MGWGSPQGRGGPLLFVVKAIIPFILAVLLLPVTVQAVSSCVVIVRVDDVEVVRELITWSADEVVTTWGKVSWDGDSWLSVEYGAGIVGTAWDFRESTGVLGGDGFDVEVLSPGFLERRDTSADAFVVEKWSRLCVASIFGILVFVVLRDSVWRRSVGF